MYCLDANIWVYYFDETLEEHRSVVENVDELLEDVPLFTTTVLQMEVVHYLHRQFADSSGYVDRFLFLKDMTVAELRRDDVETAATLLQEHPSSGIGGRDATVIAAMQRFDVTRLWTHDKGLKRLSEQLEWLEVTDPVTPD